MRFNISIFVLAAAASSGVMAAPFAEPAANAQKAALERRTGPAAAVVPPALKWTSKQVLPNVISAGLLALLNLRQWTTNLGPDDDVTEADINQAEQQPDNYYNIPQGTQPLVPN